MTQDYTVLADNSQIEKPINDDRQYRFIKLNSNDLTVLLINDSTADKSAASLDVNVGSFADKQYGIPGLAHFCEHLLFMGTKKYPSENDYQSYLSKHSGSSNAYTSSEHTNYYFQISSDFLEGALDRFSQFFINPLFSQSCQDREIKAVDSENKKNLQNDDWRFYQLDKSNSNASHPYNGFSTGNYKTLHEEPISHGINVRDMLLRFYKDHYSSNLMSLVILGKEDIDNLTAMAIEKFSAIPNSNFNRPNFNGELIYPEIHLKKLTRAKPVKDSHSMELNFMIPDDLEDKWDTKPQSYFSHLIGHESEGSIVHLLKKKGWVTELSSGMMKVCQGNSLFIIDINLTPEGFNNWENIIEIVFNYLALILNDEPKQWIFDEIQEMSLINFKFKQKTDTSSTVSKFSNILYKFRQFIPGENLLNHTVLRKFNPEVIKKFGSFLNKNNFRIFLVSQSFSDLTKTEKWYGTEYEYENFPDLLNEKLNNISTNTFPELHYPKPNDFIPFNFEISQKKVELPQTYPFLIEHNNKLNVWYKQDDTFEIPKGTIELVFHLPNSNYDVKSSTISLLISELLNDELNEITYYASLVGLHVNINCWRDGFTIRCSGYNHKLPILLEQVIKKFLNFKPDVSRFESNKFKLSREFKNFAFYSPYQQIGTYFLQLINEKVYTFEDKLKILNELTFDEVEKFNSQLFEGGIFSEVLIHGNFDTISANNIKKIIGRSIDHIPAFMAKYEESAFHLQNYILNPNEIIRFEMPVKDSQNLNSCIEYYIQVSTIHNLKLRVLIDLLSTIIREPCFDQLRTKEQLGYVVFSGTKISRTSIGFRILIQSEKSTNYLESRIENFLTTFEKYITTDLSDDDFNKFKNALRAQKLQKLKHLGEETNRIWNSIVDGYYDFEGRTRQVEQLETITKTDFIEFFKRMEGKSKLILNLNSQRVEQTQANTGKLYTSIEDFHDDHELGGVPKPVAPLSKFIYDNSHL
ncbi:unnamed protein product [Candida verbasci]|uniref:A-factor-processing enzyme n=1 Tax=Candida verbasci TaxID=1227364 RepID=A0A9W4U1Y4_9ASCO|nr:unnamed protein product [Candida verbasci]